MQTQRFLHRLSILFLFAVLLGACKEEGPTAGADPATTITVSGILNDEAGLVVPGAYVEVLDGANARLAADTTDDAGAFSLEKLSGDPGTMKLRIGHEDFEAYAATLSEAISAAGGSTGMLLRLHHGDSCCARLTVVVTDEATHAHLSGVEVRLRRGGHLITIGTSDSNGVVSFGNVCHGEFDIRLAREGYGVVERGRIAVHGCDSTRIDIAMHANDDHQNNDDSCCHGVLRIMPRDSATNAAITGASVRIGNARVPARTLTSTGDGAIFRDICQGTYNVRIAREGYRVVEFSITVGCDDSITTERRLGRSGDRPNNEDSCCHGRAVIIMRDSATNALLAGATVTVQLGDRVVGTQITNGDGRAVIEHLCPGQYVVNVTREHSRRREFRFTITCNGTIELAGKLFSEEEHRDSCCMGRIQINTRDAANGALNGATVTLRQGGKEIASKVSAEGRAVFEGLCAGTYLVTVRKERMHTQEFTVDLTCNQRYEETKRLEGEPRDSCCSGTMGLTIKRDGSGDELLAGVTVTVRNGDRLIAEGTSDANGHYTLGNVCGDATYTVTFSKEGYRSKTVSFTYTECRNLTETIRLVRL